MSHMSSTNTPAEGVLGTHEGRPALRFERRLAHSPERVWQAITDPGEVSSWFPASLEIDLRLGGAVRFEFPNGEEMSGEVRKLDPPRLLEYTWDEDVLRYELRPEGDGCLLVFINVVHDLDTRAKVAAGWHDCLNLLEANLEGRSLEETMRRWDELYPVYLERFGMENPPVVAEEPDGTLETGPDGTQVLRFERLFNRPVERVWGALTRPDELVRWLAEADIEPRAGGQVELRWLNTDSEGNQSVARGTITAYELMSVLEIDTDIHGRLRFELERVGESCRLIFTCTVSGLDDETLAENLGGWHIHLDHIAETFEGKTIDWATWDRDHMAMWQVYRDRYAARLAGREAPEGSDGSEGLGRREPGGP